MRIIYVFDIDVHFKKSSDKYNDNNNSERHGAILFATNVTILVKH